MQDLHALFTGEDDTWEDCLLGVRGLKPNNYEAVCSCHIIFTQMNLHFKCISLAYYTLFVIWFLVSYDGRSPLAILSVDDSTDHAKPSSSLHCNRTLPLFRASDG